MHHNSEIDKLRQELSAEQKRYEELQAILIAKRVSEEILRSRLKEIELDKKTKRTWTQDALKYRGLSGVSAEAIETEVLGRQINVLRQKCTGLQVKIATSAYVTKTLEEELNKRHPRLSFRDRVFGIPRKLSLARPQPINCSSVFDPNFGGHNGAKKSVISIGATRIPIMKVPNVTYFKTNRMCLTEENVVPLECVSFVDSFNFCFNERDFQTTGSIEEIHEDVCILSNLFSMTFGHWLDEELVKVFILEKAGFRGRYVICADAEPPPFIKESMQIFGVDRSRIIHDVKPVTRFASVTFTPVIVHYFALRFQDVYREFRRFLLSAACADRVERDGKRIWLERKVGAIGGRNQIVNWEELRGLLVEFDFELVDMGALSFRDQINTAARASVMAGAHGSGMKHTLFQKEGSVLIECLSPNFINKSVLNYILLLMHQYHMVIIADAYEDYRGGLDLEVDLLHLRSVLQNLPR